MLPVISVVLAMCALILTGSRLVSKEYKIAWIYGDKHGNRDFSYLGLPTKNIRNSPWSLPPELIFGSFGLQEPHLSNDLEINVKGVGHAKLRTIFVGAPSHPHLIYLQFQDGYISPPPLSHHPTYQDI